MSKKLPTDVVTNLLVYPLSINIGKSKYKSGDYYYLVDAKGNLLAGTDDPAKVCYWSEICNLTQRLVNGEHIELQSVTSEIGKRIA